MKNGPVEDGEESCEGSGRDREDVEEGGFGGPLADCSECCREGRVLVDGELGFRFRFRLRLGTTPLRSSSFHSCVVPTLLLPWLLIFIAVVAKSPPLLYIVDLSLYKDTDV